MPDLSELRTQLYGELPEFARELILGPRYREIRDPYRETFAGSPDSPLMHSPRWHQWGIITHTRQVGQRFETELPRKLEEWFGSELAERRLGLAQERLDGISRWELLLTSAPAHDWGKFTVRWTAQGGTSPRFRFGGHEAESGVLVRERSSWFLDQGLSAAQVEYVARCAELHFKLGKVRDRARNRGGYNLAWARSSSFLEAAKAVMQECPGFEREVGLFFLADNWGKTDLLDSREFEDDDQVRELKSELRRTIEERQLHPGLIECALQLPTNTAVGRRYLELFLSRSCSSMRDGQAGSPGRRNTPME